MTIATRLAPKDIDDRAPDEVPQAKPRKSELKRMRIIEAAAAVFRRRGYAQATLSEIAAEAGTQAGSLYYYFEGREQLVEEVLGFSTRRLQAQVEAALEALPPGSDSLDRLITVLRTHVYTVLVRDDFSIAYQKVHDQVSDEMRERVAKYPRIYALLWNKIIEDARNEGFLRPDLDPRLMRLLLIGSITWMGEWYKSTGPSTPADISQTLIRLFFEGASADRDLVERRIAASPPPPMEPAPKATRITRKKVPAPKFRRV